MDGRPECLCGMFAVTISVTDVHALKASAPATNKAPKKRVMAGIRLISARDARRGRARQSGRLRRRRVHERGFPAQFHAALVVDADAFHPDHLAHLRDVFRAIDAEIRQLGNVDETIFPREHFNEAPNSLIETTRPW